MRKFKLTPVVTALYILTASITLTGCLGGGGDGSSATLGGLRQPDSVLNVPYFTPVKQAIVDPLENGVCTGSHVYDRTCELPAVVGFTADLTNTGGQNYVIAGRESQGFDDAQHKNARLSIMGWSNGHLVDQTAQWFSGTDNIITGTEPSVKFADLTGNGYLDMVVAPSTDSRGVTSDAYVFLNDGSHFTRETITLNNVWAHDSTIASLSGFGTPKDIVFTDYGPNTTFAFNDGAGHFATHTQGAVTLWGASSVAAADFTTNGDLGQKQLVFTDVNTGVGGVGGGNAVYSWSISGAKTVAANDLTLNKLFDLPVSRFANPAIWNPATYGFGRGNNWVANDHAPDHNVRTLTYDFNSDGYKDILIFSRPWMTNDCWPNYSELQFLQNDGTGTNFTDVTDAVRVGYNTHTAVSYNPQIVDLFGNGSVAIILSGSGFGDGGTDPNANSQILLKTTDGNGNLKFTAAYQNILTDFVAQSKAMQVAQSGFWQVRDGGTINIIKSPDNKLYLLTMVAYDDGTSIKESVYMSLLGGSVTTAQAALSAIKQTWPWMSAAQANTVLANTATNYFNFGNILDLNKAMNPVGELGLTLDGNKGNLRGLGGYLSGVKLTDADVVAIDSLGRDFKVNMGATVNSGNTTAWTVKTGQSSEDDTMSQAANLVGGANGMVLGMQVGSDNNNFTLGTPAIKVGKNVSINAQFTSLDFSPWLQMSGSWGTVKGSTIMEMVGTYREGGYSAQFGLMHDSTAIEPGLITKVDDIYAAWAEAGYANKDNKGGYSAYIGVRPIILQGSVEATLPTSVDYAGNVRYTSKTFDMVNPVNSYVRFNYKESITKTLGMDFSGTAIDNGQYQVKATLKLAM